MYVIADREKIGDPWSLIGYQWRPDSYVPMMPDAQGRLWLDAVGVWLGADEGRLICYRRDGTPIGGYVELQHQLDAERQRAEAAEARMRELEAELRRLRG